MLNEEITSTSAHKGWVPISNNIDLLHGFCPSSIFEIYMCTYLYIYIYTYRYTYIYIYIHMYANPGMYTRTHTHMCTEFLYIYTLHVTHRYFITSTFRKSTHIDATLPRFGGPNVRGLRCQQVAHGYSANSSAKRLSLAS